MPNIMTIGDKLTRPHGTKENRKLRPE